MPDPTCPKCGGAMESGFVLDATSGAGNAVQSRWQEGPPDVSIWVGVRQRGHEQRSVATYCCTGCGYLESYAAAPA